MIHFPSSLHHTNALPRRTDSLNLNATQQKSSSHQIFSTVEEELHDARRVHSHGQEEDLRYALNMLIGRLSQLSTLLGDAYRANADLEVQLNVTKSNLQLVISNNEMLEDALKRDNSGHAAKDVGWRRSSGRAQSTDDAQHRSLNSGEFTPTLDSPVTETGRFFKFRFTGSSPNPSGSSSGSRPGTPVALNHLNSPSLPTLPIHPNKEKEHLEELERELEKERKERQAAKDEKAALEAELESLSQALFEEANKMVASERIRRADVEEELNQARLEKEALRSALKLLEGENVHLRSSPASPPRVPPNTTAISHDSPSPLTPSPTALSDSGGSPQTQHLPPSLSALPTRLPPPEPLAVPTTPFDYDALYGPDTATPRRIVRSLDQEDENKPEEAPISYSEPKKDTVERNEGGDDASAPAHRPPSLRLLPHEHDPWADVSSSDTRAAVALGDVV